MGRFRRALNTYGDAVMLCVAFGLVAWGALWKGINWTLVGAGTLLLVWELLVLSRAEKTDKEGNDARRP
jgi:hypothetical protein